MKLIDKIHNQLKGSKPDSIVDKGYLSDGSGSWVEVKPKNIDLTKKYFISTVIQFNGKGTKIESVESYKEHIEITFNSEIIK